MVVLAACPLGFVAEVGNRVRGAAGQRGAPRLDAHHRHGQAAVDVQIGLAAGANRLGEVEVGPEVSAAVAGRARQAGVLGEVGLVEALAGRIGLAVPLLVLDAHLAVAVLHHAARAVEPVVDAVSRQHQPEKAEDGAVVHPTEDHRAGVARADGAAWVGVGDGEGVHRHGQGVGDAHQGRQRVRAVVGGGDVVAPVAQARRDAQAGGLVHRVVVLALGVAHLADLAGLVQPAHLLVEHHVGVVLGEQVHLAAGLHGAGQGDRLGQRLARGGLAHHVLAGAQGAHRQRRVLVEEVGEDHGIHRVAQERVEVGVGGHAVAPAGLNELLLPRVAQGDQLHAGVRRPGRERLPSPHTDDADAEGGCGVCHGVSPLPHPFRRPAGRSCCPCTPRHGQPSPERAPPTRHG